MMSDETTEQHSHAPPRLTVFGTTIHIVSLLQIIGIMWIGFVSWWIGGIAGLGVAIVIAGIARFSTPVITTVFAHIGLFVMQPDLGTTTGGLQLVLFELGLLVLLNSEPPFAVRISLVKTAFISGLVLLTLGIFSSSGAAETSVILCCLAVGVGYLIHRYEQVSLGLVTSEQSNR
jgi:hypothetical protein